MSATLHFRTDNENSFLRLDEFGDVNLSNRNARLVLSALGFSPEFEDTGALPIIELENAIALFRNSEIAEMIDNGKETIVNKGQGAIMIDCGMDAGYITARVDQIADLLKYAKQLGATYWYFC